MPNGATYPLTQPVQSCPPERDWLRPAIPAEPPPSSDETVEKETSWPVAFWTAVKVSVRQKLLVLLRQCVF